MRLDAPVAGKWMTDGWPLVRQDGAVNPAIDALESAAAVAARLQAQRVEPMPVGTVIAVGPYVSKVTQPTADLARGIRILHPEPTTLLTAARELAVYARRCPVDKARAILAALAPGQHTIEATDLVPEGFADGAGSDIATASTTVITRVTDAAPTARPTARVSPSGPPSSGQRRRMRWLPVGAAALIGLLLVTGIVVAVASGGEGGGGNAPAVSEAQQAGTVVGDTTFVAKGAGTDATCAEHAYGDIGAAPAMRQCSRLVRARYEARRNGRSSAVLVADLTFTDPAAAGSVQKLADSPGSGGVSDASADGVPWPDGAKPFFESAAYTVRLTGADVRIVQAVWLDRPSTPDDPVLAAVAKDALGLPPST